MTAYTMARLECISCGHVQRASQRHHIHEPGSTVMLTCKCTGWSESVRCRVLGKDDVRRTLRMVHVVCESCGHVFSIHEGSDVLRGAMPEPGTMLDGGSHYHWHQCVDDHNCRTYVVVSPEQARAVRRTYRDADKTHLVCDDCRELLVVERQAMSLPWYKPSKTTPGHLVQNSHISHDCPKRTPCCPSYVVVSESVAERLARGG